MPQRKPPGPRPGPPELQMDADQARDIINTLLAEGHALMETTQISPEVLEQFEANCKRWSNKGYEHLRRMWDQDSYAETFAMAALYGNGSYFQRRWDLAHQSLRTQIHDLEEQLDKIQIVSTSPARRSTQAKDEPTPSSRNVFNIQGNVGTLTVAEKVRDIKSTVHTVTGSTAEDVQRLTQAFADALSRAKSIGDEDRDDALDQLKAVAEEAAKPGTHKRGMLRAAIGQLGLLTQGSADLHAIYDQWHTAIQGFLSQDPL